jgi:hypothetical protein
MASGPKSTVLYPLGAVAVEILGAVQFAPPQPNVNTAAIVTAAVCTGLSRIVFTFPSPPTTPSDI